MTTYKFDQKRLDNAIKWKSVALQELKKPENSYSVIEHYKRVLKAQNKIIGFQKYLRSLPDQTLTK